MSTYSIHQCLNYENKRREIVRLEKKVAPLTMIMYNVTVEKKSKGLMNFLKKIK